MKNFKSQLTVRLVFTIIITVAAVAVYVCGLAGLFDAYAPRGNFGDFLRGFQTGILTAMIGITVYSCIKIPLALKNEQKLKNLYIKENDEREKTIKEKSGYNLFVAYCFPMLLATIVAGYFSETVFFTLLATIAFIEIEMIVLKLYHKHSL